MGGESAGGGEVFEAQSVESAAEVVEGGESAEQAGGEAAGCADDVTGGVRTAHGYGAIHTSRVRPPGPVR